MPLHKFRGGSFTSELWIDGKRLFSRPTQLNVEFSTGGTFAWLIADATGLIVKAVPAKAGGWTSLDLPSLGLHKDYSVGFRNTSVGTAKILHGDVAYG